MAQQDSSSTPQSSGQGYIYSLLSESNPEVLRSLLDLTCAKLGRLTNTTVRWFVVPPVQQQQLLNPNQPQLVNNQSPLINQQQLAQSYPMINGPLQGQLVNSNLPTTVVSQQQNSSNLMSSANPSRIPVYNSKHGVNNNINPNINNSQPVNLNQPRWSDMVDDEQPSTNVRGQKLLVNNNGPNQAPPPQNVVQVQPELEFTNPDSENPFPQKMAGIHPGAELYRLDADSIVNTEDYYLIINPPYQGKVKPAEPVFQDSVNGLFYNSVGDCLQTNRTGRILVFKTKKGELRYATWPRPRQVVDTQLSQQVSVVKTKLREYDLNHGLTTMKNPNFKSGMKGIPALLTVDKNKKPITREDHPEYFALIDELRILMRRRRGIDVIPNPPEQEPENKEDK